LHSPNDLKALLPPIPLTFFSGGFPLLFPISASLSFPGVIKEHPVTSQTLWSWRFPSPHFPPLCIEYLIGTALNPRISWLFLYTFTGALFFGTCLLVVTPRMIFPYFLSSSCRIPHPHSPVASLSLNDPLSCILSAIVVDSSSDLLVADLGPSSCLAISVPRPPCPGGSCSLDIVFNGPPIVGRAADLTEVRAFGFPFLSPPLLSPPAPVAFP